MSTVPTRVNTRRIVRSRGLLLAVLAAGACAGLALAPLGTAKPSRTTACPVSGGTVETLSVNDANGATGQLGPETVRGLQLAVDEANAKGGILGCKITLRIKDDKFDTSLSTRLTRQGILQYKPKVVWGSTSSAGQLAMAEITNPLKLPLISSLAGEHIFVMDNFQKYNFMPGPTTFVENRALAQYMFDNKVCKGGRIGIITPNFAYGRVVAAAFSSYYKKLDPKSKVVSTQLPDLSTQDYTPFITATLAKNPGCIIGGLFGSLIVTFYKQFLQQNLSVPTGFLDDLTVLTAVKNDVPTNAYADTRGYYAFITSKRGKAVIKAFQAKYNRLPSEWVFEAVNAFDFWRAGVEKAGSFEGDKFVAAIETRDPKSPNSQWGGLTYASPYSDKTRINRINHEADVWVNVGPIVKSAKLGRATYHPRRTKIVWMHDVWIPKPLLESIIAGKVKSSGGGIKY